MELIVWRKVLLTAVPCAISVIGKTFIPEVVTGMKTIETPNNRMA